MPPKGWRRNSSGYSRDETIPAKDLSRQSETPTDYVGSASELSRPEFVVLEGLVVQALPALDLAVTRIDSENRQPCEYCRAWPLHPTRDGVHTCQCRMERVKRAT